MSHHTASGRGEIGTRPNQLFGLVEQEQKARTPKLIVTAGNGGSAAIANHLACDINAIPGYRAISLCSDIVNLTRIANDFGYENVFIEQLRRIPDIHRVVLFSVSKKSPNIIKAKDWCKIHKIQVYSPRAYDPNDFPNSELEFHAWAVRYCKSLRGQPVQSL